MIRSNGGGAPVRLVSVGGSRRRILLLARRIRAPPLLEMVVAHALAASWVRRAAPACGSRFVVVGVIPNSAAARFVVVGVISNSAAARFVVVRVILHGAAARLVVVGVVPNVAAARFVVVVVLWPWSGWSASAPSDPPDHEPYGIEGVRSRCVGRLWFRFRWVASAGSSSCCVGG